MRFCFLLLLFSLHSAEAGPGPWRVPYFRTNTTITVSATDEIPNKAVLDKNDLRNNASLTPDGALRSIPAFSLFRRTGSRTANPTTQGVSLRGVGASGASRALVLQDGVPLNDPFGGWVYWNRVQSIELESAQVVRGGTSDIYGPDALSGTIEFVPSQLNVNETNADVLFGNQNTSFATLLHDQELSNTMRARFSGKYFRSSGDYVLEEQDRGSVDARAGYEGTSLDLQLQKDVSNGRFLFSNSYYKEDRNNGTQLQSNGTELWQGVAGGDFLFGSLGQIWFRVYGSAQSYDQTFSAVSPDRDFELLTRIQHVPAQQLGFVGEWNRQLGQNQTLYSGLSFRNIEGESQETVTATKALVFQGGEQRTAGWFLQDRISIGNRTEITLGSRVDLWQKLNGHSRTIGSTGELNSTFGDVNQFQWSPRVGFQYQLTSTLHLNAMAYRSFRPPTLNELYRAFRVGSVLTLANENLQPETLNGYEGGVQSAHWSANLFWNQINNPIANVTLSIAPDLITRKRMNIGHTTTRGVELQWSESRFSIAYQYADSRVEDAADPSVDNKIIPQVPAHTVAAQYDQPLPRSFNVHLQVRAASKAYDDDRNELVLPGYWLADLFVTKRLTRSFELVAGVENLFNQRIVTGRTPLPTVAPSTLVTAGVRLNR